MANLFDTIQDKAFDVVTNTMGYDASWEPSAGGDEITGRVLLNKPTQKDDVLDEEYDVLTPKAEYKQGDFPGLFESIRSTNNEVLTINAIQYNAYRAEKKFDGKTIIITLQQI